MHRTRFTESQIVRILKEVEAGRTAQEVCREYGVSRAAYYKWKSKYGGMEASDIRRIKELEEENRRLKQMYADLSLDKQMLQDVLSRNRRLKQMYADLSLDKQMLQDVLSRNTMLALCPRMGVSITPPRKGGPTWLDSVYQRCAHL